MHLKKNNAIITFVREDASMKKILVFLAALTFGLASASAMTEAELKEKLTQSYEVNGVTFKATDQQKTLIEQYLNQYDVSSSDADTIYAKLQAALNILKNSGKKSFYDLSTTDKQAIVGLVNDVATNTSVNAAIVDGQLVVYVPGSTTGAVFYKAPVTPIAQTGSNRSVIVAGLGLFSLLGVAVAFKKIKNA